MRNEKTSGWPIRKKRSARSAASADEKETTPVVVKPKGKAQLVKGASLRALGLRGGLRASNANGRAKSLLGVVQVGGVAAAGAGEQLAGRLSVFVAMSPAAAVRPFRRAYMRLLVAAEPSASASLISSSSTASGAGCCGASGGGGCGGSASGAGGSLSAASPQ